MELIFRMDIWISAIDTNAVQTMMKNNVPRQIEVVFRSNHHPNLNMEKKNKSN